MKRYILLLELRGRLFVGPNGAVFPKSKRVAIVGAIDDRFSSMGFVFCIGD
jgi:hypothetical protein